jgi:hypothetical protein
MTSKQSQTSDYQIKQTEGMLSQSYYNYWAQVIFPIRNKKAGINLWAL